MVPPKWGLYPQTKLVSRHEAPDLARMHIPNQDLQRNKSHKVSTTERAELRNLHLIVFDC